MCRAIAVDASDSARLSAVSAGQNCRVGDTARDTLSLALHFSEMATEHVQPPNNEPSLELPVEELLKRAKPLPPHEQMVIEGLTEEEGLAWLDAVNS